MSKNKTTCVKCIGAKKIMTPRETKGFNYEECTLCKGSGEVSIELADDYIFSLNEENYDDDYESNNGW